MQFDFENFDIVKDLTFQNDINGPAQFVFWRNVPVGVIRLVTAAQISSWLRRVPVGERKELRDQFKKRQGKWYDTGVGDRFFDNKEEAARHIVLCHLQKPEKSPLILAALRDDRAEVERLLQHIR